MQGSNHSTQWQQSRPGRVGIKPHLWLLKVTSSRASGRTEACLLGTPQCEHVIL